jgi:PEP-CTERM motif
MKKTIFGLGCATAVLMASSAQAAWVMDVDIDGLDDGPVTLNPNFGFNADTGSFGFSSSASNAVGHNAADSIASGGATLGPDTYITTYTPAVDGDNVNVAGLALNDEGDVGGALLAGGSSLYRIYATWPTTNNVSGGLTTFALNDGIGDLFNIQLDQNTVQDTDGDGSAGDEWIFLGEVTLDANTTYTLTQNSSANTFVSMRLSGYLFDAVPEPASLGLMGIGGLALLSRKRR